MGESGAAIGLARAISIGLAREFQYPLRFELNQGVRRNRRLSMQQTLYL